MKGAAEAAAMRHGGIGTSIPWLVAVGAVWFGWQIVIQPVTTRAPPALAVRIAPDSPSVLRRSAEAELQAERIDNAGVLAAEALARTPFDVRALRVLGLSKASADPDAADEILTLAGNWSLRDDPAHAWLIERRLRQGNYSSALAHADTLVRRRSDLHQRVFNLFTVAASHSTPGLMAVADRLAVNPPWRQAYIDGLYRTAAGYQVAVNLALALDENHAAAGFNDAERYQLYINLLDSGRGAALPAVRTRLDGPDLPILTDGDFSGTMKSPLPFAWSYPTEAGLIAEVLPAGDDGNPALRVDYSGASTPVVVRQLLMLAPGEYAFAVRTWIESGPDRSGFRWTLTCANGVVAGTATSDQPHQPDEAFSFGGTMSVPASGCPVQWLQLSPNPVLDAPAMVNWFDDLTLRRQTRGSGR